MDKHLKKGMTYHQLTMLLGEPECLSGLAPRTLSYTIMVDFGNDIDPVEAKTLLIELTADSLINSFKINHYKRGD